MAISKININGVEHELQTTIDNITNLQPSLDKKLDKTGGTLTGSIHVSSEDSETVVSIDNGEVKFDNGNYTTPTSINAFGATFMGGESEIVLDGFGESGCKVTLQSDMLHFIDENDNPCGKISGLVDAEEDHQAVPFGQMKEYAMPKYNEGIPTYQNDPEFEGKNYCVDIPDLTELKVGTEITIIPHVTSTITGPSLTINGGEKIGMRVLASTTNSSFNGTRPDFMAAGAPVKLMYMERTTVGAAAYTVLTDGKIVSAINTGTEANGYYMIITDTGDYEYYTLYSKDNDILERLNLDGAHYGSEYLVWPENYTDSSVIPTGSYTFSNGTDASTTPLWRIMNSVRVNAEALMSNNAEGGGMYPCTPGQANEKLVWNPPAKVGADINKNSVYTATSTDGVDYVINNVLGVDSLYTGLEITFKPNTTSTSKNATLNINGLGSAPIRLPAHGSNAVYYAYNDNFLYKNKPITVVYDATGPRWITANLNRPIADAISGTVAVANGGTGRSSLTSGRYLVGNGTGAVTLKTKAQVLADIGAVSLADFNALLARVEEVEAALGIGEGGDTITFYYDEGDQTYELTADAGMTWAEFIESDYNPSVECGCCGGEQKLIQSFEEMSGGDSGDGEIVGFCCNESPNCYYSNNGDTAGFWVCYEDEDAGLVYVELNDVIMDGRTYCCEYILV